MTDAQIAGIVRQITKAVSGNLSDTVHAYLKHLQSVQERNEAALTRIEGQLDRLNRRMTIHDMKDDGETARVLPWHRLKERDRRILAEDAYQFLCDHRDAGPKVCNESNAASQVFKKLPHGYPSEDALRAYCYSVHMMDYIRL